MYTNPPIKNIASVHTGHFKKVIKNPISADQKIFRISLFNYVVFGLGNCFRINQRYNQGVDREVVLNITSVFFSAPCGTHPSPRSWTPFWTILLPPIFRCPPLVVKNKVRTFFVVLYLGVPSPVGKKKVRNAGYNYISSFY